MKLERDWSEDGEMSSCAKCNSSFVTKTGWELCTICFKQEIHKIAAQPEETHEEIRQIIDKLKRKEGDE